MQPRLRSQSTLGIELSATVWLWIRSLAVKAEPLPPDPLPEAVPGERSKHKAHWHWLAIPIVFYLLLRLPPVLHQSGGQDEQFFSVPGWTVYQEGIPRVPYLPTRQRATYFENADRCLMALPPGLFYLQAPFFAIFPAGYPTSRLPSFLGALVIIVLAYYFAIQLGAGHREAFGAACVLTISRPLMFTGTIARPDLLCCLFGLLAMMSLYKARAWGRTWTSIIVGALCGLAALFHPSAIVFFMMSGAAFALSNDRLHARAKHLILLSVSALAVFALWLPLILYFPREFFSQFFANVLERSGPGLPARMLWPFASLRHQLGNLYELLGLWQLGLLAVTALFLTIVSSRSSRFRRWDLIALVWSSVYFTATFAGIHPTLGYWLFPTIIVLVCGSVAVTKASLSKLQIVILSFALFVIMLPGAGLRTSWLYLRHFGQTEYHGQKFIAEVLSDLPEQGLFIADLSYVFDVYLSGRETLLAGDKELYWGDRADNYAYLLMGRQGMDEKVPAQFNAAPVGLIGDPTRIGKCYVHIYSRERP